MLKKFISNLKANKLPSSSAPKPSSDKTKAGKISDEKFLADLELTTDNVTVIPRGEHPISRKNISPGALKVLHKLEKEGFQAFLVGGSVRDLILGKIPKDFDIATNATPEQLNHHFKNARIIGRRFKIVHIRFGREIIEVTTFRAHHSPDVQTTGKSKLAKNLNSARSTSGMIIRDSVYGDISGDAARRDFTVNALYYSLRDCSVLDFTFGLEDIELKQIRMIGEPSTRFREDPVRMLRAIRFSAKLNFEIEPATRAPINECASLLESISPARLFDETLKLLSSGYGQKTFELLQQYDVGKYLLPATLARTQDEDLPAAKLVKLALRNTDERIEQGKSVTPAFLFAALLWPVLQFELTRKSKTSTIDLLIIQQTANSVIAEQCQSIAIPKRFSIATREIWELQSRLQRRNRRSVQSAYRHPRFRAAYDFLLLREESGEELNEIGQWWTKFQICEPDEQASMLNELTGNKRRRRRKRSKSVSANK
jgi:poly(A) polymerase